MFHMKCCSHQPEPEPQGYNLKQVLKIDVYSRCLQIEIWLWTKLFFFTQENLPNPVRHVRLLLLYPILRDRGSPLHRILNSPFHVVTFLSIIHVICRKRRQILDGENFSKFTKFMILGFKIHQLLTSLIKEVPRSEQGRRKEKPLEDI